MSEIDVADALEPLSATELGPSPGPIFERHGAPVSVPPSPVPKEDWRELAWRPAGSMSLAESWLSAGTPFRSRARSAPRPPPPPQGSRASRGKNRSG